MLKGKTALVTGSTSGIGLGIAVALASAGARIVLNGFGDAAPARDAIEAAGGEVLDHLDADLMHVDAIEAMMTTLAQRHGGCDVLVNNAGIQHVSPVESFPAERWDAIIALNLSAAFHTTRLALPGMRAKGWGRVLQIASVHGLVASAQKSAYVAAKHGIVGLTKAVALEMATTGVTCNAICPGWVLTPLVQKQVDARALADAVAADEAQRRLLAEKQPSLRFTRVEDLGALAVFLCSEAAANVQGQAWAMDGGWTAQ